MAGDEGSFGTVPGPTLKNVGPAMEQFDGSILVSPGPPN